LFYTFSGDFILIYERACKEKMQGVLNQSRVVHPWAEPGLSTTVSSWNEPS